MDSEKLLFYEALLQQLHDDDLEDAAASIKQKLKIEPNGLLRRNHLFDLFRNNAYLSSRVVAAAGGSDVQTAENAYELRLQDVLDEAHQSSAPQDKPYRLTGFAPFCDFPTYRPCRCVAESHDGSLMATAGAGGALHVIPTMPANGEAIRRKPNWQNTTRLQGHQEQIDAIDFHPRRNIIASGGAGCNILIHDVSIANGFVHSVTDIQRLSDSSQIRCLRFHPCGDFLVVGTSSPVVRLYDITTRACYTSNQSRRQHQGGSINGCDVLHTGGLIFTAGDDGSILMWDGKNLDVLRTMEGVHGGSPVLSVRCEKYGRYLTSSGQDGTTKVTDLRMMRELTSVGRVSRGVMRASSDFMFNSRFVTTFSVVQTGRRVTNEVLVYCVDTGSQEADISSIMGRAAVFDVLASKHDMALYLLIDDSSCKVISFFEPPA
ncbi:WD domain, G-beta repeat containing protein, putative [Babesia bigemina]|uniref:Cleavage stimulation factor 50 kDa subunit n=1 Tax=Babesia bigemina TaxID=5866 RepID=A0A061D1L6_BABBI|nr:WD domain, G-beta repeat containing protein, putative [Babesia bigemina]CDR94017.1 WD domain, G-beta repeat containing protein, putative [Babesia bigemina]|eukprot:XP_012766203.1 WD domain, G-beta repeat containing protein, putative [Babesia bigemina]